MRRLLLRSKFLLVLALAAACADDIPEVVTTGSSSGDDSTTGPGPVTLTADSTTEVADTTEGTTEPGSSSSGEPGSSSSGEPSSSSSGGAVCGDDTVEGDEPCDGSDLAGSDCAAQGFDAGRLACMADCSDFDTSACVMFSCGNDAIEGMEACDGNDLDGSDCLAQGFDAGTLACAADCSAFDTSACVMFSCGNDAIEGMETCDGTDLAGSNCLAQGFDGGTLGCAPDCTAYDTTACLMFSCGNDAIEGMEICDGTDLGGVDCLTLGYQAGTIGCLPDCTDYDVSSCTICGNGVVEGPEPCDGANLGGNDCSDLGFDGGTLACAADCTAFDISDCGTCGNGVIEGAEDCEGADLGGQICATVGFDFGTLECGAGCAFDTGGCVAVPHETEPNDDTMVATGTNDFSAANANGPFTTDILLGAAISPAGDDDIFAVSNPGPGYVFLSLETFGPGGPGFCALPLDTVIEVRTAANVLITSNDQGGINSCSLLSNLTLPPGVTVYVRVIDFQDNDVIPSYFLDIRIDPVVCGDGTPGPGEQCDDGGLVDGDGCSSTCVAEAAIQEIEPNGTNAQADATGIVANGSALFGGVIGTIGDLDRFRLELAAPQIVRFETFSAIGVCNGITTSLRLFDAAGVQIIADTAGTGISQCAALTFPLPAGTFYVQVEETGNNAPIATYLLEVAVQGDAGVESEPNEDLASADGNLAGGVSNVYVFGDHSLNVDSDFFAIDVPVAGSSLRLEIIEGDRAVETCESNGVDARITLYDAAGVQIVDDDDAGRGFCSLIDGTGTIPLDPGAHALPAGTYYVQVRASTFAQASAGGQFIYRLAVTMRAP